MKFDFLCGNPNYWFQATGKMPALDLSHEASQCRKDAVLNVSTLPTTTRDIGECFSTPVAKDEKENRQSFLKVLSNVRFLGRQALPLRGAGDESDSNFHQLLRLRGEDDPRLLDWIQRKKDKYTSPEM